MYVQVTSLNITSLRAISSIRENSNFTNLDISFSSEDFPTELIHLTIHVIQSKATNPEEQALGNLTRINLKRLSMWDE